ncbi:MAG: suppressor of fused domain protein [Sandaracinus sp.]|nr:suppressor of fused domain protein [Sandaracinus sp.]
MTLDFSSLPDVSEEHPELAAEERWFVAHIKAREGALEAAFGKTEPPDTRLAPDDVELSTAWPGGGFHRYPPRDDRPHWLFVTHGLSQPFEASDEGAWRDDPEALSGLGLEYVMAAPQGDARWPLEVLHGLVRHTVLDEESLLLEPGGHLACSGPIGERGALTHLLATLSPEYELDLLLPAGHCVLVHLVGVTQAELARALREPDDLGGLILERVLYAFGVGGVTDPDRACLTNRDDFDAVWNDVRVEVVAELSEDD